MHISKNRKAILAALRTNAPGNGIGVPVELSDLQARCPVATVEEMHDLQEAGLVEESDHARFTSAGHVLRLTAAGLGVLIAAERTPEGMQQDAAAVAAAALAGTLTFSDYQVLARALCRQQVDCEQAIALHRSPLAVPDTERDATRAYLVGTYEKEMSECVALRSKLRAVFVTGPGSMVLPH